jgi:hypothetical protein
MTLYDTKDWNHRSVVSTDHSCSTKALAYVLGRDKYVRCVTLSNCKSNRFEPFFQCRIWDVVRGCCIQKFRIAGGRPTAIAVAGADRRVITCDSK